MWFFCIVNMDIHTSNSHQNVLSDLLFWKTDVTKQTNENQNSLANGQQSFCCTQSQRSRRGQSSTEFFSFAAVCSILLRESHSTAQTDLTFTIFLLPQHLKDLDYRHVTPFPANRVGLGTSKPMNRLIRRRLSEATDMSMVFTVEMLSRIYKPQTWQVVYIKYM